MKLSLITAAAAALTTFALGCGTSEADKGEGASKPAETPTSPTDAVPPRQLVDGKALPTSPVNLLADPAFSLIGREQGYGSFLAFYDGGTRRFELAATLDSRSPAGFGGAVALVRPEKATDTKSDAVILLTSFPGGKGPFHAKIWASKSNGRGEPVETPTDGSAVKVSIMEGSPESRDAFDLQIDPAATRTIAGRTWILLRGDITKPLDEGAFFVVRTGKNGGHVHLAAPEVTSDEVTVGQAVMARPNLSMARTRMKDASENVAIKAYREIPPRLMPAAPRPELGD